jgi:hypothetical protein
MILAQLKMSDPSPTDHTSPDLHESNRKPRLDLHEMHRKLLENEATMERLKSAFALVSNALNGLNGSNGSNGLNGLNGSNGLNGLNGSNGLNGPNGEAPCEAPNNDRYGREPASRGRGNSRFNRNSNYPPHSNGYRSYKGTQN